MPTHLKFHPGERSVQRKAGEADIADRNSAMISDSIVGGAIRFIKDQHMVVVASIDGMGGVWSSVLYGDAGFASAGSTQSVTIRIPRSHRDASDPLWQNLESNSSIGLLFIELGSRRRYRINGQLIRNDDKEIEISVTEAYPNCPKYIQRRRLKKFEDGSTGREAFTGTTLDNNIDAIVQQADTMFVASNNATTGADASHRGGNPGFVRIVDAHTLLVPDYNGNGMFNTLGNIELDPRTGLCIPDFAGQRLLQLTGRASLLWDQPDPQNFTGGTGRFLKFDIDRWILRPVSQHLEWEYIDASPYNLPAY